MSDLERLLTVQDHDTRGDQLRHRRATLPERAAAAAIDDAIAGLDEQAAVTGAERDRLAAEERRLESELVAGERKEAELQRRLAHTAVPREAEALQAEVRNVAAHRSRLEDGILELMEQVEPLEDRLAAIATQRAELGERAASAHDELQRAEATIDAEAREVAAARHVAVDGVPAALLDRYERQRARLGGIAVARLEHGHCTGCNLELSRRELEAIRAEPPDALVECEHCGRLLVR